MVLNKICWTQHKYALQDVHVCETCLFIKANADMSGPLKSFDKKQPIAIPPGNTYQHLYGAHWRLCSLPQLKCRLTCFNPSGIVDISYPKTTIWSIWNISLPPVVAYLWWQVWFCIKFGFSYLKVENPLNPLNLHGCCYCQLPLQTLYGLQEMIALDWRHSVVSHPFTSFLWTTLCSLCLVNVWNGFTHFDIHVE